MNCNVVKDLIPLYIDGCCSEESKKIIEEHIKTCNSCKTLLKEMNTPQDFATELQTPLKLRKINDWKASVLQSILLFLSFALITLGVSLEASTPLGLSNGFWAINLVIPSTGFMLSLANWYFVRIYKNRKTFTNCSLIATLGITVCAFVWAGFHYKFNLLELFSGVSFEVFLEILSSILLINGIGIFFTIVFCILSKTLSNEYAKMLGKE